MAHALVEQHLEVHPLHGAGVLELVNHDVFQMAAHLLENERRIAFADEPVQQVLGVAEQEPVGLVVQVPHLVFDAVEQLQFVEVSQRGIGRTVVAPFRFTVVLGTAEQIHQLGFCQSEDDFPVGRRFGRPFFCAFHTVVQCLVDAVGIAELVAFQLVEIAAYSSVLAGIRGGLQSCLPGDAFKLLCIVGHCLRGLVAQLSHPFLIYGKEIFLDQGTELMAVVLVVIPEDVFAEFLDGADDIPALVVADVGKDVADEPFQHDALLVE